MYLIVGLGNPGKEYQRTRHNVGFIVIDRLSEKFNIKLKRRKYYYWGELSIEDKLVVVAKPRQFVNVSGEAVKKMQNYFSIETSKILVIHDDVDLPLGMIRIKRGGSSGGHKGIQSIIEEMGSMEFPRVKIGIGKDAIGLHEEEKNLKHYVLSDFTPLEMKVIIKATKECIDALPIILNKELDEAMRMYNRKINPVRNL